MSRVSLSRFGRSGNQTFVGSNPWSSQTNDFIEDLCCLSWISLNSLVFTITQFVTRKPKPKL